MSENIEVKKGAGQTGPNGGLINPTQLSFDKEKKHDLNRSTDAEAKKRDPRDMMKYKENSFNPPPNTTIQKRMPQKTVTNQLDLENLNQSKLINIFNV